MKIAHVSDIHIRNLKLHDEYSRVFENLYGLLREMQPDIIVNTGDTVHSKVQISPELVQMCSDHIKATSEIAPLHILLGNHDMNLANLNRRDAVSPIVESIDNTNVVLHKKSGIYGLTQDLRLYIFSCADKKNYPTHIEDPDALNIGLFHGTVRGCETDTEWMMRDAEVDISRFEGLDFVLMGDIHKHQFMDVERRIAYAGSLIQQNYGESIEKGFLLWDIRDKDDFDVEFIPVEGSRKFYTVELNDDLTLPNVEVEEGSRVRIISPKQYTLSEQQVFEREARKRFKPHDLVSIPSQSISMQATNVAAKSIRMEKLRDLDVQERLIRKFFEGRSISDEVMEQMLELNKRYQLTIEKEEEVVRDITWRMDSIAWNNMFNYGEGNVIDFSKMKGIIGVFGPNSSGKSSLIDVMTSALFNKISKGVSKNIHLINDKKQSAEMVAYITSGDERYIIDREIDRIKYGKKKLDEEKEWGRTSLDFTIRGDLGDEKLSGTQRTETEKLIRKRIGTYEDFILTTLLAQERSDDLIKCKETERRKILSKFIDLDIFEQKAKMAKEEGRAFIKKLKEIDGEDLDELKRTSEFEFEAIRHELVSEETRYGSLMKGIDELRENVSNLKSSRASVAHPVDIKRVRRDRETVFRKWHELNGKLKRCSSDLTDAREASRDLKNRVAVFPIEEHREAQSELESLAGLIREASEEYNDANRVLLEHEKSAKFLATVPCGNKYPGCKFLTEAFAKNGDIEKQRELVRERQDHASGLTKSYERLVAGKHAEKLAEHEKMLRASTQKTLDISSLELEIENTELKMMAEWKDALCLDLEEERYYRAKSDIEKNAEIDLDIERTEKMISLQREQAENIAKKMTELNKKLGATEIVVEQIGKQMEELRRVRTLCDAYEHYGDAMGKHGISYQILVEKLPLINVEINKILSTMVDFNVVIDHDESDQAIRMHLQYGDHSPRVLELAGGAEKLISSIAIRAALLSITNLPKTNMFIIDEGFGSLDPDNLDNINKMFDYLRMNFDHVIVISHIDLMKDMVDYSIEITRDDKKFSHVEVI